MNARFLKMLASCAIVFFAVSFNVVALSVGESIPAQSAEVGQQLEFTIPENAFSGDSYMLRARLSNGDPLPDWLRLHFSPTTAGTLNLGGCSKIEVVDDKAYLFCGSQLKIVDISNPSSPALLSSCDIAGDDGRLLVEGNYAYLSTNSGLNIVDISDPNNAFLVNTESSVPKSCNQIAYYNNHIYTACNSGSKIVNVLDPYNPIVYDSPFTDRVDIMTVGNLAYMTGGYVGGLSIWDLDNTETNPTSVGGYFVDAYANQVAVANNLAYVNHHYSGLKILDISDIHHAKIVGSFIKQSAPIVHRNSIYHDFAFLGNYGLHVLDASDPNNIIYNGNLEGINYELDFYKHYLLSANSGSDSLIINDMMGVYLMGTPGMNDIDVLTIKIIANDLQGQTVETTFDLTVTPRQFNLPTTTIYPVTDQTDSYLTVDGENVYFLDKVDNDLQITLNDDEYQTTIPNFKNGEQGIQITNQPIVLKADFKISQYTKDGEVYSDVIALDSTHIAVAYFAAKADHRDEDFDFYGQIIDLNAQTQADYFDVSTTHEANYHQVWTTGHIPNVVKLSNGNFVVTWLEGTGWQTGKSKMFAPDGTGIGSEFGSCSATYGTYSISTFTLGAGFAVTCAAGYGNRNVNVYDSNGTLQSSFPADHSMAGVGNVVGLNNGNIVITTEGGYEVYAQIFDTNGNSIKDRWLVSDQSAYLHSTTLLNNGNFFIVWRGHDGTNDQIMGSIFTEDGTLVTDNFFITSTPVDNKALPRATSMANGNIFVVWHEGKISGLFRDQNGYEIYGAIIDQTGNVITDSFRVNNLIETSQYAASITHLGNNQVAITWTSESISGPPEIYGTILDASSITSPNGFYLKGSANGDELTITTAQGDGSTNNILVGLAGNDTLSSEIGSNIYAGGYGSDQFIINQNTDVTILDFNITDQYEKIDLSNFPSITSFSDLTINQIGDDTVIDLGSDQLVTLKNIDASQLRGVNFVGDASIDLTATNLNQNLQCSEDTTLNLENLAVDLNSSSPTVSVKLTLSNISAGILTTGTNGSTTSTYDSQTGIWFCEGPKSEVNALLANVQFEPTLHYNEDFTIDALIQDDVGQEVSGIINVDMVAVNDAPTVSDVPKVGTEDTVLTFTASDFEDHFADVDGNSLVKIKVVSLPNNGVLKLSGGAITLNQDIDLADLNNLTFEPDSNWYGSTNFDWQGYDGSAYSSNSANVDITINSANDTPELTATLSTLNYIENDGEVVIDNGITLADIDSANIISAIISISSGFIVSEDRLGFVNQNGITGSYNSETGILTLTGSSSIANYQEALRSVTYINNSENPTTTSRAVSFQANDGEHSSNTATKTISITRTNDTPTISNISKIGIANSVVNFTQADFTSKFVDVDNDGLAKIQILSLPLHGNLKLSGNIVSTDDEILTNDLNNLTFEPEANWAGDTSFTWRAYDGTTYSNNSSVNLTIENDAPIITTTNGTLSYIENYGSLVVDNGLTITDIDSTTINDAIIKITGAFSASEEMLSFTDQHGIVGSYNDSTGELTLTGQTSIADYQSALRSITYTNNSENPITADRTITFQVNDGIDNSNIATRTISVTAVNDIPVIEPINKSGGANMLLSFVASEFTSKFYDTDGQTLQQIQIVSLPNHGILKLPEKIVSLNDEILVTKLHELTFEPETNWAGITSFTWKGHDGETYSNAGVVNISIENEAPMITTTMSTLTYTENSDEMTIDDEIIISDTDSLNIFGATVSITEAFSASEEFLGFSDQNGIVGNYDADTGVLTLAGATSITDYQEALRSVTYVNDSENPITTNRIITFQINDGITNSNVASKTIGVIGVNDAPVVNDINIEGIKNEEIHFDEFDFRNAFSDFEDHELMKIKITDLPTYGTLKLSNGLSVTQNSQILTDDLNDLTFEPETDWIGETTFKWQGHDSNTYSTNSAIVQMMINEYSEVDGNPDSVAWEWIVGPVVGGLVLIPSVVCPLTTFACAVCAGGCGCGLISIPPAMLAICKLFKANTDNSQSAAARINHYGDGDVNLQQNNPNTI